MAFQLRSEEESMNASMSQAQRKLKNAQAELRNIAPRDQSLKNHDDPNKKGSKAGTTSRIPRTRLPPRSRWGCWTCRTRKVKCDEAKPECTPCSRLGHKCDYGPRLSFKHDTTRVIKKLVGDDGRRGPVWDPSTSGLLNDLHITSENEDQLPPFSGLTNDEDREKKAGFHEAGTYNVIVNPKSFEDYIEYRDLHGSRYSTPSKGSRSSHDDQLGREQPLNGLHLHGNGTEASDDQNTVILKVFEDDVRKASSPRSLGSHKASSPRSVASQNGASSASVVSVPSSATPNSTHDDCEFTSDNTPLLKLANRDGRDHQIIYHYKNFVYNQIAQVQRDSLGTSEQTGSTSGPDIFEEQAAHFRPVRLLSSYARSNPSVRNILSHVDTKFPSCTMP